MLAVVVDDYAMNISDIIRGDDHLTNTFKQIIIYNALEWKIPKFSHIPLIYGQDGSKLSKRHGAQSVLDYKKQRFMPEALNNYLLRLGWGHKDKEFFSVDEAINLFNIEGIGKSPSKFDKIKLESVNTYYFKRLNNEQVLNILSPAYKQNDSKKLLALIDLFKSRAENINDIEDGISYMQSDDIERYSDEALKIINSADKKIMLDTINELENISLWQAISIEEAIKSEIKKHNLKMFDIAAPIRASITGKTFSPSIFLVLEKLGKKVSIERLKKNFD
jgi:glutamyl-tRNA synthetase